MSSKKLYLIDGHALCYRSFYAIRELINSRGQATNAVYGFVNTLKKILRDRKPEYIAACFDSKGKTFREEKYSQYKIQRPQMPEDLRSQIGIIKEVLEAYHIPIFEEAGHEADDLIATLAMKAVKKNIDVVIISDDKDLFQLADKRICFLSVSKDEIYGYDQVKAKYGFDPIFMTDFLGLAGDSADNIPGVRGVGKVTAQKLINEFGSIESMFENIESVNPVRIQEKLINEKATALLSKELAVLKKDIVLDWDLKQLILSPADDQKLYAMFKDLEFRRFAEEHGTDTVQKEDVKLSLVVVKTQKQALELIKEIQKQEVFSYWIQQKDQDLFESATYFYIALKGNKVFDISFELFAEFKEVFENPKITKVVYDLKSSVKFFAGEKTELVNAFDVMLAGYLFSSSAISAQLSNLVWNHLKISLKDGEEDLIVQSSLIYRLYEPLLKSLKEQNLLDLLTDVEEPLSVVLAQMEMCGVSIDVDFLDDLSKVCQKKIDTLTKKIYKVAGEEFNLNSPKQLSQILFEKLKLPTLKKTKTGYSTNEAVLNELAEHHEVPFLILDYRQIAKLKSTYIDALPTMVNSHTNRVHAEFNQIGAETGRLSSKNPNLQNIPIRTEFGRQIRKAIIPQDGWDLLAADYSQIELRILAHLSQDETLMKAFQTGQDIHSYTSSLIFDVSEKDVTKDMRYAAKRVNFGIVYGMSAYGLAKDLKVSQSEAQDFINRYFTRYPKVKEFMDAQVALCEEKGYVVTLLNRQRHIPEINSTNMSLRNFAQRQAINTPVQGSAADLIKLAMINVSRELKNQKLQTRMIITVHDELVFEVPKTETKKVVKLLENQMTNALTLSVPIEISMKVGANWLEMEDVAL